MQTAFSNTTPEEFAAHVARLRKLHEQSRMVVAFDQSMESGDDKAADELGKRIWAYETRRITRKPCGKKSP